MLKKNVIIFGPGKTGKTTLARKINETYGCEIQSTKNILESLERTYPSDSAISYSEFETKFLVDYIKRLSSGPDFILSNKNVVEINTTNIAEILSLVDLDRNMIIGLSHGEVTPDELYGNIRKNEGDLDLTHFMPDESLKVMTKGYLLDDKKLSKLYENNNIKTFITSNDRDNVLNEINKVLGTTPNTLRLK